jgi:hypothetical protein
MNENDIEELNQFLYVSSMLTNTGGAEGDVKTRIQKANAAFVQLNLMWRTSELSIETKLKIVRSDVKPVLLCGCETWEVANKIIRDLQTFINIYVREIGKNSLPNVLSNQEVGGVHKRSHSQCK